MTRSEIAEILYREEWGQVGEIKLPEPRIRIIYPPGSPEAVGAGCTCPVYFNQSGAGAVLISTALDPERPVSKLYCIREDCPVHYPIGREEGENEEES